MERGVKALDEVQRDRMIRAWAKEIKTQLDRLIRDPCPSSADRRTTDAARRTTEADLRRKAEAPAELVDSSKTASILV
jgi:hypothetical protein